MSRIPIEAWAVASLLLLAAGGCLLKAGLPGLLPRRGKRRAPKERLPRLTIPAHRPSTEDDADPPLARPPLTDEEHAQFWDFVEENPLLASRLTQLWAGIEEEESAS